MGKKRDWLSLGMQPFSPIYYTWICTYPIYKIFVCPAVENRILPFFDQGITYRFIKNCKIINLKISKSALQQKLKGAEASDLKFAREICFCKNGFLIVKFFWKMSFASWRCPAFFFVSRIVQVMEFSQNFEKTYLVSKHTMKRLTYAYIRENFSWTNNYLKNFNFFANFFENLRPPVVTPRRSVWVLFKICLTQDLFD